MSVEPSTEAVSECASEDSATEPSEGRRPGGIAMAVISLALSIGYLLMAFQMPFGSSGDPGPGMWPRIVGVGWVLISAVAVIDSLKKTAVSNEDPFPRGEKLRLLLLFIASTIAYVVLIPFIGAYFTAPIYTFFLIGLLRGKWDIRAAIYGVIFGVPVSFIFIELLQVRLTAFPW